MDKAELLSQFEAKVDEFARYQAFIEKAEGQADRFAAAVVEKVISSNREKSMAVVEDLIPLTSDVEEVVRSLNAEKASITQATEDSTLRMQELELRLAIGELDQDGFDNESADLKKELDEANEKVGSIDEELQSFESVLSRWNELGQSAGVLAAPIEPDAEESDAGDESDADEASSDDIEIAEVDEEDDEGEELEAEPLYLEEEVIVADADEIVEIQVDADDGEDLAMEGMVDDDDAGVHAERLTVQDDVSAVFEDSDDAETKDEEVLLSDDVLPEDGDELDILGDDEPLELDAADGGDIKPRRAVLLYAEGTPEEQVHPVTKDVVSIGRGRDNDIQVRNDSKVSRYHCKIYRRGPNYYIEDNKSANGSLVNGELITERRLFGGEEIIIGETFFRFRILD